MDEDVLQKYIAAGNIASQAREESTKLVKVGAPLLGIAERLEAFIRERGGLPAFPVNLSLNDIAAHYTPTKNDATTIPEGAVIKVDVGVHVDGYVADTAHTICFDDRYADLVEASRSALEQATAMCTPGRKLADVSAVIQETIESFGYKPVANLTGHGLDRYFLHAEPQVPNVKLRTEYALEEGQAIAIEPFATDGIGRIKESEPTLIFMLVGQKPVRSPDARAIIDYAKTMQGLPFAERWIPLNSLFKIRMAMRELREKEIVYDYPPLREAGKGMVSQAEHTVIVGDEPVVTTK